MRQSHDHDSHASSWQAMHVSRRCKIVAAAAANLADAAPKLARLCASDQRVDPVETIAAELLPLCSALRFIGRRGERILKTRRVGMFGREAWLWGVSSRIERQPYGTVLILGTWNYPLLLVGAQAAQALAAGNRVIIKPAAGSEAATARMIQAFHDAGVPSQELLQIDSSTESAIAAIDAGVDLIVLTGAAATGRKVLQRASESLTPTIMELSGCDAVVVMPDADLQHAADAIAFGLTINSGATCISPRRLIVEDHRAEALIDELRRRLVNAGPYIVHPSARHTAADTLQQALQQGAVDRFEAVDFGTLRNSGRSGPIVLDHVTEQNTIAAADLFAPVTSVMRVREIGEAVGLVNRCPYRLAASVFGPTAPASRLAEQLQVGTVCVNDLIMPTGDPRLPFGGRGHSGFGVTRGTEGLLAMTTPRVVSVRTSRIAPHLMPRRETDGPLLLAALHWWHASSTKKRWQSLGRMVQAYRGRSIDPLVENATESSHHSHAPSAQPQSSNSPSSPAASAPPDTHASPSSTDSLP